MTTELDRNEHGAWLWFFCPGCDEPHGVKIEGTLNHPHGPWSWNGDREKPTLQPSVLHDGETRPDGFRCHSFVTDGRIQFLSDCTHAIAGQTVPLPADYEAQFQRWANR